MKTLRINPVVLVLFVVAGLLSGCPRKKPVLVMPQEQPPTAAPTPAPQPAEAQKPADQQAPSTNANQNQQATPQPDKSTTRRTKRRASARKTASPSAANNDKPVEVAKATPQKQIIRDDKADPTPNAGLISPAPTPADTAHDQASIEQALQGTEAKLDGIKRQLSKEEDAIVTQSREFIAQSRKAATENDLVRAYNLATKARLLADELVKQR